MGKQVLGAGVKKNYGAPEKTGCAMGKKNLPDALQRTAKVKSSELRTYAKRVRDDSDGKYAAFQRQFRGRKHSFRFVEQGRKVFVP